MAVRQLLACAREPAAAGHGPAVLSRVLQMSRQAICRVQARGRAAGVSRSRAAIEEIEQAIVEVASETPPSPRRASPRERSRSAPTTARRSPRARRPVRSGLGVSHRRGGCRDPESCACIESWSRCQKERCKHTAS